MGLFKSKSDKTAFNSKVGSMDTSGLAVMASILKGATKKQDKAIYKAVRKELKKRT